MKRLYFIRHGLSQSNVDDVWGGQNDTPLTTIGREQAKQAGIKASKQGLKFDLIIASPLSRALDTAKIIAAEIGYPFDKIKTDKIFIERSFGIFDGKPNAKTFYEKYSYKDLDDIEGSETVQNLQKRAESALKILKTYPDETILLVGHGAFGRALKRVINGRPFTDEFEGALANIPNAEIFQLI